MTKEYLALLEAEIKAENICAVVFCSFALLVFVGMVVGWIALIY